MSIQPEAPAPMDNPAEGPMTARQTVETAFAADDYSHLVDPNVLAAKDALSQQELDEIATAHEPQAHPKTTEYTPSARVGKPWQQVASINRAINAQLVSEGKEPYYAIKPVDTKR